ncbi:MAG: DNA repair protein RecO [Bacteroidales bacterium]|jgi:DNA repair protein RecO (recombination protein O)|nr:DNA repair protein RecO [Bacteroidales bacterium]
MSISPYIKTQGIVLKTFPYSETSCIARVFTPHHGVIPCLIKGIRTKTAKNKLIYFKELSILNLELKKHKNSEFYNVIDVKIDYVYAFYMTFSHDINKSCVYLFINELVNKCVKDESQSKELYDYIFSALMEMDNCKLISPDFHVVFTIQLLKYLGLAMNFDNLSRSSVFNIPEGILTESTPEHDLYIPPKYVNIIKGATEQKLNDRIIGCDSNEIRRNILNYLQLYYRYHIPNFKDIKSIVILRKVFEV